MDFALRAVNAIGAPHQGDYRLTVSVYCPALSVTTAGLVRIEAATRIAGSVSFFSSHNAELRKRSVNQTLSFGVNANR